MVDADHPLVAIRQQLERALALADAIGDTHLGARIDGVLQAVISRLEARNGDTGGFH